MSKNSAYIKKWVLIAAISISLCAISGCMESYFNLARESRLPRGIALPPGLTRADVSVTVDYDAFLPRAYITLRDKRGRKLAKVTGKTRRDVQYLKSTPKGPGPRYPVYELVFINGVTEILEQRRPEDILYITDDPAIRKELVGDQGAP